MAILDFPLLHKYFNGDRCHLFHKKSVEMAERFKAHSEEWFPDTLIDCRRPNEPLEVKEYRRKIYVAKTYPSFSKIVSSLGKIRRSPDWSIKYPEEQFSKIAPEETLQKYSEEDYPEYASVTNWVFSVLMQPYLTDPNAVILQMPEDMEVKANEFFKPIAYIFDSCNVIEFIEGKWAVLEDPVGCYYSYGNKELSGRAYYVVDEISIQRFEQVGTKSGKGNFAEVWSYDHGLPEMPAYKLKAVVAKSHATHSLYKSRIEGVLVEFDECLRENSDLQAGKVNSMYPERWEYTNNECISCKGTGQRTHETRNELCECEKCEGRGYVVAGPYSKMVIRPNSNLQGGGNTPPLPPAGYIQKDIAVLEFMSKEVNAHIYNGLSAINFQFLEQVPLNQSGLAKEVDKEELNNTVHSIAEDIVRIMDTMYRINAFYRYKNLYSEEEIKRMLPSIPVPDNFDLLSAVFMQQELDTAKKSMLNPVIINAMEIEYSRKRFINEPEITQRLALVLALNPLPNIGDDTKALMLSNNGISQVNYVISCNVYEFVQRAIDENKNFIKLPLQKQKEKMQEYAEEMIEESSTKTEVIGDDGSGDNAGNQDGNTTEGDPNEQQANSMADEQQQQQQQEQANAGLPVA